MAAKPNYTAEIRVRSGIKFLVMEDMCGPTNMSLTNCIEDEIPKLLKEFKEDVLCTVYCDTEGNWDIVHEDPIGTYKFIIANSSTMEGAMDHAIESLIGNL